MSLDWIESSVREAVTGDPLRLAETIEALIAALLSRLVGFPPRATDGFIPIREEITATSYFAVGEVFMIEDQSSHPVWLDLSFGGAGMGPGTVHFGVRSVNEVSSKLETALLAYPRETAAQMDWTHEFERRPGSWVVLTAPEHDRQ